MPHPPHWDATPTSLRCHTHSTIAHTPPAHRTHLPGDWSRDVTFPPSPMALGVFVLHGKPQVAHMECVQTAATTSTHTHPIPSRPIPSTSHHHQPKSLHKPKIPKANLLVKVTRHNGCPSSKRGREQLSRTRRLACVCPHHCGCLPTRRSVKLEPANDVKTPEARVLPSHPLMCTHTRASTRACSVHLRLHLPYIALSSNPISSKFCPNSQSPARSTRQNATTLIAVSLVVYTVDKGLCGRKCPFISCY